MSETILTGTQDEATNGASSAAGASDDGMMYDRQAILNADDAKFEIVPVPEWGAGAKVRVRSFTAGQRDAWERSMTKEKKLPGGKSVWVQDATDIRAKAAVQCIVKANGERVFSDGDVPHLTKKSAAALDRIFDAVSRLSGISGKDMEAMEENSEAGSSSTSSAS
jgi:hypothetical protein